MCDANGPAKAFLTLTPLIPDQALARQLPAEVARRCRALPVAQDNGHITVVMAEPEDQDARAAITAAALAHLGKQSTQPPLVTIVQGDPAAIDMWLAALWPPADEAPGLTVWTPDLTTGEYAQRVAALVQARLAQFQLSAAGPVQAIASSPAALVVAPCHDAALRRWLMEVEGARAAVLVACRPRWPLRRLLVIVRGDEVDDEVLVWAARLARPGRAAVTALMVAPPALHGHRETSEEGIASLLTANHAGGRRMRRVAQRLAAWQLESTLHLRQGAPDAVIRQEWQAQAYDLTIVGIAVRGGEAPWRLRPFLDRLLDDAPCPLLLVRA